MSAERRLAKLEGTLSPRAATLLWLTELHDFPTLPAYVTWLVDQPASAAPLYRVPEAAEAGVRAALRGEKRDALERAAREAVRQAVILVELVLKLNVAAEEAIRLEGLRYAALFWQMRAISGEAQLEPARPSARDTSGGRTARWTAWRAAVASLVGGLYLAEEARAQLERRYLERTPTLFPDLATDWQALREQAERLAGLGDVVAVTDARVDGACRRGRSSRRPAIDLRQLRGAALDRAPEEAAFLVDAARAAALDALGDTDGAATIAERRLRLNAEPASTLA